MFYENQSGESGKVDFVVQIADRVIPMEVKAEESLQAKSLQPHRRPRGIWRRDIF